MNKFDKTNNESALTKLFKSNGCVGLQGGNNKGTMEKHQMNLQKGAGG